jgi:hypothetical protein
MPVGRLGYQLTALSYGESRFQYGKCTKRYGVGGIVTLQSLGLPASTRRRRPVSRLGRLPPPRVCRSIAICLPPRRAWPMLISTQLLLCYGSALPGPAQSGLSSSLFLARSCACPRLSGPCPHCPWRRSSGCRTPSSDPTPHRLPISFFSLFLSSHARNLT